MLPQAAENKLNRRGDGRGRVSRSHRNRCANPVGSRTGTMTPDAARIREEDPCGNVMKCHVRSWAGLRFRMPRCRRSAPLARMMRARLRVRARPREAAGPSPPPWMSCFVMRRPCDVMKCHVRSCARPCAKRGSRREGARRLRCRSTGEEAATGRGCRDTGPAPARRGRVPERPGRGGPGRSRHSGCNASRSVPGSERPCALSSRPAASSFDGLRPAGPCPNRTRAMWQ